MKSLLIVVACAITTMAVLPFEDVTRRQDNGASAFHTIHKRWQNSTCTSDTQGNIAFNTEVGGLTVTGLGSGNLSSDILFALNINSPDAFVMNYTGDVTVDGMFSGEWHYGQRIGGIQHMILATQGNFTVGSVDGRNIIPFTTHNATLTFTDGTPVPAPTIPADLASTLNDLSDVIKDIIQTCQASQSFDDNSWTNSTIRRQQDPFGTQPEIEHPESSFRCVGCIGRATGASAICGIDCGRTLGAGCNCVIRVPFMYTGCHRGGSCCPVFCGPHCCSSGRTCLNASTGTCCLTGRGCGGKICCNSGAPCRQGICCPDNRNICQTASGTVCCPAGEQCVGGMCCPMGDIVVNGSCCSSNVCCTPGSESRCFGGGIQTCIGSTSMWNLTACPPPLFCLHFPVAGAGVACVGAP